MPRAMLSYPAPRRRRNDAARAWGAGRVSLPARSRTNTLYADQSSQIQTPATGPWAPAALTRRAMADLTAIAEAMYARRRAPHQIGDALLRQAELHRQDGAELPADVVLCVLRQLPGLAGYDPLADWQQRWSGSDPEAEGIDASGGDDERREWARRHHILSHWFRENAGTASAERKARAIEQEIRESLEGKNASPE